VSGESRWSDADYERVVQLALAELRRYGEKEPPEEKPARPREPRGRKKTGQLTVNDDGTADYPSPSRELQRKVVMLSPPRFGRAVRIAASFSRFPLEDVCALAESSFDADQLRRHAVPDRGDASSYTLPQRIRLEALGQLDLDDFRDLELASDDPLYNILRFASALDFETGRLRERSVAELTALLHVRDALQIPLPPRREIERALELVRMLEPLRTITRTFAGRTAELEALRDYAGVFPGTSGLRAVKRAVKRVLLSTEKPLLVFGPGGIGKTTLVARFIVDHARATQHRIPFAYLDFDRVPATEEAAAALLIEAVRQLGLQFDDVVQDKSESLRKVLQQVLRSREGSLATNSRVLKDLSSFLRLVADPHEPILFVIDTFEEVQLRSEAHAHAIVELMKAAMKKVPMLRVVIAGRIPVRGLEGADQLKLSGFDRASAVAFLAGHGVDAAIAERVVDQFGRSPLTLNLALDAIRTGGVSALSIPFVRVSESVIQGQLFDRILLHVHDAAVRRLVHPGLVLRRITPELIRDVLAVPCEVDVPSLERARELFDGLAREVTLYSEASPGALALRPDVRQMMLSMVNAAAPRAVEEIHKRAVAYYEHRTDVPSRAEEIYHRLALGQPREVIEPRMLDGVEPYLVNAIEELRPADRAVLALLLSLELSPDDAAAADQETWERLTARRVRELMETCDYDAAAEALATRKERTAQTELRVLEARLAAETTSLRNAMAVADVGIAAYSSAGNTLGLFEMLLASTEIRRNAGRLDEAQAAAGEAESIARRRNDPLLLVRALRERAELAAAESSAADEALLRELAAAAGTVPDAAWPEHLPLLRAVAAHTGSIVPSIFGRAARLGALQLSPHELDIISGVIGRSDLPSADAIQAELKTILDVTQPPRGVVEALVDILGRQSSPQATAERVVSTSHRMRLAREQKQQLHRLLISRFNPLELTQFVEARFARSLDAISFGTNLDRLAVDLIQTAEAEGWMVELVAGLVRAYFGDSEVQALASSVGFGPTVVRVSSLEAVSPRAIQSVLASNRGEVSALEARICTFESAGRTYGCGLLVGPDVVVTARSVIDTFDGPYKGGWICRFDPLFIDGEAIDPGQPCRPSRDWLLHAAEAYALVKIDTPMGDLPLDFKRAESFARHRGWIPLSGESPFDIHRRLFWMWRHARGTAVTGVEADAASIEKSGRGIALNAPADPAAAGAPVFDSEMNVVAMHLEPAEQRGRSSILPLGDVLADMARSGVELRRPR
jgi:hypothetical protein